MLINIFHEKPSHTGPVRVRCGGQGGFARARRLRLRFSIIAYDYAFSFDYGYICCQLTAGTVGCREFAFCRSGTLIFAPRDNMKERLPIYRVEFDQTNRRQFIERISHILFRFSIRQRKQTSLQNGGSCIKSPKVVAIDNQSVPKSLLKI